MIKSARSRKNEILRPFQGLRMTEKESRRVRPPDGTKGVKRGAVLVPYLFTDSEALFSGSD